MSQMLAVSTGVILVLFCLVATGVAEKNDLVASKILAGYNKNVAPDFTKVDFALQIITVDDLDVHQGVLSLDTWLIMYWKDTRLAWKGSHLENLAKDISLPSSLLWIPDITLYNSANGFTKFDKEIRATVSSTGKMTFIPPVQLKSRCYIDPYSPNENMTCALKFGSWTSNGHQMDLELLYDHVILEDYFVLSPDWVIVDSSVKKDVVKYDCCPEPYVSVTCNVVIRRRHPMPEIIIDK